MKKIIITICLLATAATLFAQSKEDTTLMKNFRLDFAVPDMPAFKMLGTNPSNILRPSSPQALSLMISEIGGGDGFVLPKSFAAELAPYILMKSRSLTLEDYDKNSQLYNLRLSLGTSRNPENSTTTDVSIGFRSTLIDKGDLKNDQQYRRHVYKLLADKGELKDKYQDEYLTNNNLSIHDVVQSEVKKTSMNEYINNKIEDYEANFDYRLDTLKQGFKERNWNKQKLDVALAMLGSSPDSLTENIEFNKFSLWSTYGAPVGTNGQILLGFNYNYFTNDSLEYGITSLTSRFYGGSNSYKGFGEIQVKRNENLNSNFIYLALGGEINIKDGIWANISAGLERNWTDNNSYFVSHFDLRFTIPEDIKLF
ncbi:hypothetical protein QYS49_36885 [Marivirga salinae]|uniref:DUF5723 domain-containing protein n=1 Tax=Marivirga salinarum TaxID=3059078 RepID=A0AA51NCD3_9BACT|nr:hypothetical protein [Marivirga sp. BDSF4-3]WMN11020.1 hypothetical protein QYS49_36885 [Marivirga sp. BDSF4-3]